MQFKQVFFGEIDAGINFSINLLCCGTKKIGLEILAFNF